MIRRRDRYFITGNSTIVKQVYLLLRDKFTVPNPTYAIMERQVQTLNYRIRRLSDDLIYLNKGDDEYEKKFSQRESLQSSLLNAERYLRFNEDQYYFVYYNSVHNQYYFYLGLARIFKTFLKKQGFRVVIVSNYKYPNITIDKKQFNREYQYEAVSSAIKKHYGIIKLPTGSGKTLIAENLIRILTPHFKKGFGVTFLVEQKDLLLQTKDSFPEKIQKDVGFVGSGMCQIENKKIIIATVQTLHALKKKDPVRYKLLVGSTDLFIIDECDMFTTKIRTNILKDFSEARWRYYLSATPFSRFKEEKKWRLKEIAGGVIYTSTEKDLIRDRFLSKQKAIFVDNYSIYCDNKKRGYGRFAWLNVYKEMIVENKHRNEVLLLKTFELLKRYKLKALFIVEQEFHGNILSSLFNVPFYKGSNNIYERKEAIRRLEKGIDNIIITTRIFRRAINIPSLDCFVNACGYKSDSMVTQAKGRIGRITKDKNKSLYIDFFDYGNKYLENHSEERMKTLKLNNIPTEKIEIDLLEQKIKEFLNKK